MTETSPTSPTWTPRYPALIALALCVVWVLVLFLPMFAGQFLGSDLSDQTWTGIPFRQFWSDEFHRTGSVPLWNPFMFGGLPFVGAMHGDMYYPTSFLRLILAADQALNVTFFIHMVLAGAFTYLFLRVLGTSWTAAVTGALGYQLSGIVASQVSPGHDGKMIVSALLPLLLAGLVLAIRKRRIEAFGLVALVVGLDILSPHVQTTQYSLIFAGIFTLYLCFWDEQRPALPKERWTALGLASLAVVLGMGLSLIQMMPFLANGPFAARVAGAQGWEYATSYAMPPANIMDWLVPTFTGSTVWGVYWAGAVKLHSEYLGAAIILLAAMGLANPRRRLTWMFIGVFVLFLLVCLGAKTPFYRLWYAVVPLVKVTRAPGMAFFIPTFIVCCFAAFGVERLERRERSALPLIGLAVAALLLLLGLSGGMAELARIMSHGADAAIDRIAGAIRIGAVQAALAMAAAAALAFAAVKGRVPPIALAGGLALIVGADLFVNARRSFVWSPGARTLFAPDSVITLLRNQPPPYRVLDLPLQGVESYPTAYLMYHRIPNGLGHHGNELHAYDDLLGGKNVWSNLATTRLWDLLGFRYVLLPMRIRVPGYHIAASTQNPGGHAVRRQIPEIVLYEADTLPPYARVVPAALKVPEAQLVPALMDPRLDYNRIVLLSDTIAREVPRVDSLPPAMASRATVTQWEPGRMSIRLDPVPEHDAWVVVSENWYPDWQATVDGREVKVERGQKALMAISVPRGAREIELRLVSSASRSGTMLSVASLLGILVMSAVPLVRRRRRG